ncbi:hypothetical protein HTZ77_21315 [Nonomuraea sp. SMC257]|uniref:Uncharacterized protein n=1 Tax=Nonomuraea montanisoli TaxID=2741721 RepID=A0A7Y6I934_9ACTN|nr:hypothetical protein [Nonomuraea montanisoli]NUW33952.1 hypothetical protein [Nonomuraea montanisoli]
MKRIIRTAATPVSALALVTALGAGTCASAAPAAASTSVVRTATGASAVPRTVAASAFYLGTLNCGIVTCSLYLSRGVTRTLATASDVAPDFRTRCAGSSNRRLALACAALTAGVVAARWKLAEAARKNQCLRIRFVPNPPAVVGLYSDGSVWCRD